MEKSKEIVSMETSIYFASSDVLKDALKAIYKATVELEDSPKSLHATLLYIFSQIREKSVS